MEMKLNGVTKLDLKKQLEPYVEDKHMDKVISIVEDVIFLPEDKRKEVIPYAERIPTA
ncbi:MAG: hypothetical protein NKF70_00235 [Methanobacterium sp. ERen5]|nr:MAG: hypothetical protein NKF70_00235 [Methanobacterium sp. ERen5]